MRKPIAAAIVGVAVVLLSLSCSLVVCMVALATRSGFAIGCGLIVVVGAGLWHAVGWLAGRGMGLGLFLSVALLNLLLVVGFRQYLML